MTVYVFSIRGLPDPLLHPRRAKKTATWLTEQLDGLTAIIPHDRFNTMLAFDSLEHAVDGRVKVQAFGFDHHVYQRISPAELSDDRTRIIQIGHGIA